jgi:7-cyano-7-deazaguanine synthase
MTDSAVVLTSGGIDSATCFALAAQVSDRVIPVHIRYGQQTADLELSMAKKQRSFYSGRFDCIIEDVQIVNYSSVFGHFAGGVAESGKDFDHLEEDDGRSSGYVPMRNLHLIATGAAFADTRDAEYVYHGAQAGDQADYPDCRETFMEAAENAISRSVPDEQRLELRTPLLKKDKPKVLMLASEIGVPLQYTYSCYTEVDDLDDPEPCGECPACLERAEAFDEAGLKDPHGTEVTL